MKKILLSVATLATLLTTTASASFDYKEHCPYMEDRIKGSFYDNVLNDPSAKGKFSGAFLNTHYKSVNERLSNEVGISTSITLKNLQGLSITYNTSKMTTSVDQYIKFINDKYQREGDIELLYRTMSFMARVDDGLLNSFKKSGIYKNKKLVKSMFLIRKSERLHKLDNFISMNLVYLFFKKGNKSSEVGIGYGDSNFHEWLYHVMDDNFDAANSIVQSTFPERISDYAQNLCNHMARTQR